MNREKSAADNGSLIKCQPAPGCLGIAPVISDDQGRGQL